MPAKIKAIEYYLPEKILTNDQLSKAFPEWGVDKIKEKTGIGIRHIAGDEECASDLGLKAAQKLFESGMCCPEEIDFLLFCTQCPDYFLPTTACLLQEKLHLPTTAGALDFNLGCSGYVYGLSLAKGLIESHQAKKVLLITAETYSKFIDPQDKTVRTLFGDAGAATLVAADDLVESMEFVFGTDGRGAKNLIVEKGAARSCFQDKINLTMNGPEIFVFTLQAVPKAVNALLEKTNLTVDAVDFFIFHQANQYMLEALRKKTKIPEEKFYINLKEIGNTVSCTIPIALKEAQKQGKIKLNDRVMLVGFGVGYSWGAGLVRGSHV